MPRRGNCFRCGQPGHHRNECPTNPYSRSNSTTSSGRARPPRNQERRFFDKITKDSGAQIRSADEGERLLKAAVAFKQEEGASALLYRLSDAKTIQAGSLRKALEYIPEESVFTNGFLPLLEILGSDDLSKPVYDQPLEKVLKNLYETKFLIPALLVHIQESRAQRSDSRTALIWFLTKLTLKEAEARKDESVAEMAKLLSESGPGAECLNTVLGGTLESSNDLSLAGVRDKQAEVPGGRHDNDFADFRSISIVPTLDEFLCPADPYLPKATSGPTTEAALLDRQFRLLREDILGPAKEEQDDKRKEQRDLFEGVRASHVVTGEPVTIERNGKNVRVTGPTDPCICFSLRLPEWHRANRLKTQSEREQYWDQSRRILPRDALVCLLRQNCDNKWVPIRFGTIVRRETKELAVSGKTKPVIGIAFFSQQDVLESLKELSDPKLPPTRLLVVSAELFAYQPILRSLQMMDYVAFEDEILRGKVPDETTTEALSIPDELKARVDMLDDGQRNALDYALANRVTLVQGPPGTGKTFVGVVLAQTILASTKDKILCVCYTNHALDDFLEGLLDVGIRDIVRLGGRSKNERLAEFNLREKAKSGKAPFSREQTRRYAQLKETIENASKEVDGLQKTLRREIGKGWWSTVEPHLRYTHPDEWEQLRIESLVDQDGFNIVGIEKKDHLWKLWIGGKQACKPFENRNIMPLWQLSKQERVLKKLEWQHELYEDDRLTLEGSIKTIKTAKDELKQLQDSKDTIILSQARIIGCTTTKAAMCKHLLDEVAAETVLVEEAAEIFESHILTSLSKKTKRLIMIGDHKQLRPKAQHYPLTVESNREYDLNRSLFERLAQLLPTARLGIQHRMHPAISAIPRLTTYPELSDAPSTETRPMVMGLQSRLIFFDHNESEDVHRTQIERVDAVSKTNQHEVDLVVAIVRYLFQQGYKPNNLVVLTPYLGQLLKIQRALSSIWSVFIDDMDFNEARSLLQGVEGFEVSKKGSVESSVRVATIDNYQGEEADIVIASLVRGNDDNNIGFLREPERVNVLLSRARMCEIIIGNRATLEGARGSHDPLRGGQLWKTILSHLESTGSVFGGLPVVCQSHSTAAILRTAQEIAEHSPDGGCSEKCANVLECGHPCTKLCHVGPCIKCAVLCADKCPRGHSIMRKCGDLDPPKCLHVISWKCPFGHALSGECFRGKDSTYCRGCCLLRQKEEEQLQIERQMQEALDKKYHELEESRDQLQDALRKNLHRQQMSMIEEEKALVERQLEETLRDDKTASSIDENGAPSGTSSSSMGTANKSDGDAFIEDLTELVCALFNQSESETLPATEIADFYKKQRGGDLQLDAGRHFGNGDSQMRFKAIFELLPCCEVVTPSQRAGKKKKWGSGPVLVRLVGDEKQASCDLLPKEDGANVRSKESNVGEARAAKRSKTTRHIEGGDGGIEASATNTEQPVTSIVVRAKNVRHMEDGTGSDVSTKKARLDDSATNVDVSMEEESGDLLLDNAVEQDTKVPGSLRLEPRNDTMGTETQSVSSFDAISDAVSEVVKRYIDEGALAADNLLDEIKSEETFHPSSEMQSLDYIIAQELDPSGNLSRPPSKSEAGTGLCEVVCLYAYSMYCAAQEFPLQAQDYARRALAIVTDKELPFPKDWLERAEELARATNNKKETKRIHKEDSPKEKWALVVTNDRNAPAVIDDSVLPMIGLNSVKNSMIGMYHRIKLAQEQNDGVAASYNIRFEGNPGTGKTTIARHYGTFLQQLSVLPDGAIFKETGGAKLINDGISGLTEILKEIKSAGGGIVFVDEAYQLVTDREGKKVLDFILPIAESLDSEYGPLVWIFAGYKKEMEKLFEHNVGLHSRFPHHFVFEDYSDDELQSIFEDMMKYQTKPPPFGATKPTRPSRSRPSYQPSIYGSSYSEGAKSKCRFGRKWTYRQYAGWIDDLGNKTVDPKNVGYPGSELVDPSGQFWEEEDGRWFNVTTGAAQDHYPGEPAPTPTPSRIPRPTPFHCVELDLLIAIRRLGRRRGERGFGNARAVRVLFERARDRQASRIADEREYGRNPDKYELFRTDLLGPDVTAESLMKSNAWQALDSMEGLLPVKESVKQLFQLVLNNVDRERKLQPLFEVALNRLFLGGPGTGKTTVAKYYGQILADLGLLSKGEVVYKCASDFVGDVLGASEKTTRGIIESAAGCVLVIDEAYALYSGGKSPNGYNDPYKTAVIDTIVEQVQAKPGADIAVVMLGYQAEMENMLAKVNPGLSRRFQLENAFHFPDFDDSALIRIMMAKAKSQEIELSLAVAKRAVRTLAKARAKPNFGNAGAVDNILSQAISRMQVRGKPGPLTVEDFDYKGDGHDEGSLETLFDDLIGCKDIRETMKDLRNTVVFAKAQGKHAASNVNFNYLFLGSPGTGKTTIARKMGRMFEALGLLPSGDVKEIKASDMLTGYVGQAGQKTRELLREARGGVLFIDEAYQMDPSRGGSFMTEAVDELVGALTDEEFKGKVLVILAGYDQDMERMLSVNPGLKSRFSERVHFRDFDANATAELLQMELDKRCIPLEIRDLNDLCRFAQRLVDSDGFGNGRDVVTWADWTYKQVAKKHSKRIPVKSSRRSKLPTTSTLDDITTALDLLLSSREVRTSGPSCSGSFSTASAQPTMMDTANVAPPPQPVMATKKSVDLEEEEEKETPTSNEEETPTNLFDGIDEKFLQSLQAFIDEEGLDSEEGISRLSNLDPSSQAFKDLVARLVDTTGMDPDAARDELIKWQKAQKDLKKTVEAMKKAVVGARPIWRCAVCGRANKPWIVCYVAPYIVGYEQIRIGD